MVGFELFHDSSPEIMSDIQRAQIVLHIWPGRWGLPSFDPHCLATVLFLQLTIPGKFRLVECWNPDSSPTGALDCRFLFITSYLLMRCALGQLPFLLHERFSVASFTSIVKYMSGLKDADKTYPNLDGNLSPAERAQRTAWYAHVESHLGDLVVCHSPFLPNGSRMSPIVS
jgi:sorting and assembly machinery component 37